MKPGDLVTYVPSPSSTFKWEKYRDRHKSAPGVIIEAVKVITTGEGGSITTNDKKLYEKIKLLREHGITKNKKNFKLKKNSQYPWYYEQIDLSLEEISNNLEKIQTTNIYQQSKNQTNNFSSSFVDENIGEIIKLVIYKFFQR